MYYSSVQQALYLRTFSSSSSSFFCCYWVNGVVREYHYVESGPSLPDDSFCISPIRLYKLAIAINRRLQARKTKSNTCQLTERTTHARRSPSGLGRRLATSSSRRARNCFLQLCLQQNSSLQLLPSPSPLFISSHLSTKSPSSCSLLASRSVSSRSGPSPPLLAVCAFPLLPDLLNPANPRENL